jgi:hypothetical protein
MDAWGFGIVIGHWVSAFFPPFFFFFSLAQAQAMFAGSLFFSFSSPWSFRRFREASNRPSIVLAYPSLNPLRLLRL